MSTCQVFLHQIFPFGVFSFFGGEIVEFYELSGLVYLAVINLTSLLAFGLDKLFAVRKQFRISEKALLTLSALGGCFGSLVGMVLFHHKTSKPKFRYTVPILFCLYVFLLIAYRFEMKLSPIA